MIKEFIFGKPQPLKEELDSIFPVLPEASVAYPFFGIVFAVATWGFVSSMIIFVWFMAVCFYSLITQIYVNRYQRATESDSGLTDRALYRWATVLMARYAFGGMIWGFAGWFFLQPNDLSRFMVIAFSLIAMAVGAINPLSKFRPAYIAFLLPCILPMIMRLVTEGQVELYLLAALLLVLLAALINSALATEKNKEAHKLAIKANTEKSQFIAGASHDLRQPLHSLSLLFDSLESKAMSKDTAPLFSKINASLENLTELIDSILDISKLDAKVFEYQKTDIELNAILSAVGDQLEPLAKEKNLTFSIAESDAVVFTDKLLLQRILKNLIDNAIRYTTVGEVSVLIEEFDDHIGISIEDTGAGIPANEHKKIFSEFYQFRGNQVETEEGLGLGLAIVKRLTDLLNVGLLFMSESGKGTTFKLTLAKGCRANIRVAEPDFMPANWQLDGLKAVLIDNDDLILDATSDKLQEWGMQVETAKTQQAAFELLAAGFSPDVIISDYRLNGEMSGVELLNRLSEKDGVLAAGIIISADGSQSSLQDIEKSAYQYLRKPVSPMALRRMLYALKSASGR